MKKTVKGHAKSIVCLLLAAVILAGCGGTPAGTDQSGSAEPGQSTQSTEPSSEPVTIRVFNRVPAQIVIENNPVLPY